MMTEGFGFKDKKPLHTALVTCCIQGMLALGQSVWLNKKEGRTCPPARGLPLHSTFKDFCRIPMGKPMVGSVVSQRRKSG